MELVRWVKFISELDQKVALLFKWMLQKISRYVIYELRYGSQPIYGFEKLMEKVLLKKQNVAVGLV